MVLEKSSQVGAIPDKKLAQCPFLIDVMRENDRMAEVFVSEDSCRLQLGNHFGAKITNGERAIGRCNQTFCQLHQDISPVLSRREIWVVRPTEIPPQFKQLHFGGGELVLPLAPRQTEHRIQKERTPQDHVCITRLPEKRPQARESRGNDVQLLT